jgi:hypothetical protein
MSDIPLISGPSFGPSPFTPTRPQARSPRLLPIVIVMWLLGGLGFLAVRLAGNKHQTVEASPHTEQPITAGSAEDLLHHVDAVMEKTAVAGADLHRAEDQVSRALPGVTRNGLLVEKRRLENSLAAIEAARRDLEQNREDLELISNSLKEHTSK